MGKVVVFIFEGMSDYEVTFVSHLLHADAGKELVTMADSNQSIKGRSGFIYSPSHRTEEMLSKIDDIEGLIIPGGWYGDFERELFKLIDALNKRGKLLAGICGTGTIYLAQAGVLDGVSYTTPVVDWTQKHAEVFGNQDPFPRDGFIEDSIVVDNNIITAHGQAFVSFALEICDWFGLFECDEEKVKFYSSMFMGD